MRIRPFVGQGTLKQGAIEHGTTGGNITEYVLGYFFSPPIHFYPDY